MVRYYACISWSPLKQFSSFLDSECINTFLLRAYGFSCGQIRDSNRALLLAAARQHHCEVIDLGIAPDVEEETENIFEDSFNAGINILLTSGGVSMGDRDFVKPILRKKGTVHFDEVYMKLLMCSFKLSVMWLIH